MSVLRPDLMMKCSVPVVMAGIIAVRSFLPLALLTGLTLTHASVDLRSCRVGSYCW